MSERFRYLRYFYTNKKYTGKQAEYNQEVMDNLGKSDSKYFKENTEEMDVRKVVALTGFKDEKSMFRNSKFFTSSAELDSPFDDGKLLVVMYGDRVIVLARY